MKSWFDNTTRRLRYKFWEQFYWVPVHECTCGMQYFPVVAGQASCERCDFEASER